MNNVWNVNLAEAPLKFLFLFDVNLGHFFSFEVLYIFKSYFWDEALI